MAGGIKVELSNAVLFCRTYRWVAVRGSHNGAVKAANPGPAPYLMDGFNFGVTSRRKKSTEFGIQIALRFERAGVYFLDECMLPPPQRKDYGKTRGGA